MNDNWGNGRNSGNNRFNGGNRRRFDDDRQPVVPNQPFYERQEMRERAPREDGGAPAEHQIFTVDGRLPQDLVSDNGKWAERRGVEAWYLHAYKRRFGPDSINGHVVREAFNISFIVQAVTELSSKATREIVKEEMFEDEPHDDDVTA